MSRQSQQVARLVQLVVRRLGVKGTLILAALVIGYLVAQPWLEAKLGIDLPGFSDATAAEEEPPQRDGRPDAQRDRPEPRGEREFPPELTPLGRGVYESPAGLRYTSSRQDGHRLWHVMAHARDQPNRRGNHGVFDSNDPDEVVLLIDEAYEQAQMDRDTKTKRQERGRVVHTVNLGRRIGYIGGQSGARKGNPPATQLQLVLQEDRVITAYPIKP